MEHTVRVDSFQHNTVDKAFYNGHYYTEKAPGASYFALPVAWIGSQFIDTEDIIAEPWIGNILLYWATVFSVSILSCGAAVCFRRLLCELNPSLSVRNAAILTLLVFAGSTVLPYATVLFGHQVAASLLVIGVYFGLIAARREDAGEAVRYACCSVLAFSLAVFSEYPVAVPIMIIAGALFLCARHKTSLLKAAPIALLPAAALLVHNWVSFDNPFALGYGKLQGSQFEAGMSRGFFGVASPSLESAWQLLFGPYRGLFIYSPVLVAACAAFFYWPRRLAKTVGSAFICGALALLIVNSSYMFWQGGTCFGPRHLVPAIPLIATGLAYLPEAWFRHPVLWILAAVSAAINFIGTSTTLFVSEFNTSPLTTSYYKFVKSGKISITPLDYITPFTDSFERFAHVRRYKFSSWNVGELIGLHGWWSLLPLVAVWACFVLFSVSILPRFRDQKIPNAEARKIGSAESDSQ